MGRLREAVLQARQIRGGTCQVAFIRKQLAEADVTDLDELLRDPSVWATTISEQLKAVFEIEIEPGTLSRHRRTMTGKPGGCQCQP